MRVMLQFSSEPDAAAKAKELLIGVYKTTNDSILLLRAAVVMPLIIPSVDAIVPMRRELEQQLDFIIATKPKCVNAGRLPLGFHFHAVH